MALATTPVIRSFSCPPAVQGKVIGSRIQLEEGSSLANHARGPAVAQNTPVDRAKNG